jgi:hypothetical protein
MHEATEEQYETILRTNMDGSYFLCKMAHPLLTKGTRPCIVNVSSVAGVGSTGTGAIYAMSKAAIIQLTKSLACLYPPSAPPFDDGFPYPTTVVHCMFQFFSPHASNTLIRTSSRFSTWRFPSPLTLQCS